METKSYVSMEQKMCAVCGRDYDTNAILLDRGLRNSLERSTVTGWGICPEDQKRYDEGYIALVGVDMSQSHHELNGTLTVEGAYRTGDVIHMKFEVFDKFCNIPSVDQSGKRMPLMFCDPEVIQTIKAQHNATH